MDRRSFLAVVAGVLPTAVAGCTSLAGDGTSGSLAVERPTARVEMTPVDDAELPEKVLYTVETEKPDDRAETMAAIVDGGTTVERLDPPFPEDRHLSYGDAVYRLDHDVVSETPATLYSVQVDILETDPPDSATVQFSDLPAVDREAFAEHGLKTATRSASGRRSSTPTPSARRRSSSPNPTTRPSRGPTAPRRSGSSTTRTTGR